MAKSSSQFVCQECGASHSKWAGRCSNCGAWNSLVEEVSRSADLSKSAYKGSILKTAEVGKISASQKSTRLLSGVKDVDTVLGGGFVSGSVNLIAGQPGIGKSTFVIPFVGPTFKEILVFICS